MMSSNVERRTSNVQLLLFYFLLFTFCFPACPGPDLPAFGAEATLQALVEPPIIPADGESSSTITVVVRRKGGERAADGTPVSFSTNLGLLSSNTASTKDGSAVVSISSTTIGKAAITIQSEGLKSGLEVTFVPEGEAEAVRGGAASIELLAANIQVPLSNSTVMTAIVKDLNAQPVQDGAMVVFSTEGTNVVDPIKAETVNGIARARFTAGTVTGEFNVNAQSGGASGRIRMSVLAARLSTIRFVEPAGSGAVVGVIGSGLNETVLIRVEVLDELGKQAPNGTPVQFTLFGVGGGEELRPRAPDAAATGNGIATARLVSGRVAGPIQILAEADLGSQGSASAVSPTIHVTGGRPAVGRFFLIPSEESLNVAGFVKTDSSISVTALATDRFNNPVVDGSVHLLTEAGTLVSSVPAALGADGRAAFEIRTGPPFPIDHTPACPAGGGATAQFGNACLNPEDGQVTLMAYVIGEEGFFDVNGNGRYDETEDIFCVEIGWTAPCTDPQSIDTCARQPLCNVIHDNPEPFLDSNDNGARDASEIFVDFNGNGTYDPRNGARDASTLVWDQARILYTDAPVVSVFSRSGNTVTLFVGDRFGNALEGGSTIILVFAPATNSSVKLDSKQETQITVPATANPTSGTLHTITFSADPAGGTLGVEVLSAGNGDLEVELAL